MAKKSTKKIAKKSKTKSAKRKKNAQAQNRSIWGFLFKWTFVAGLWAGIFVAIIVAWYASELPGITSNPKIERKNAVTVLDREGLQLARYGDLKGVSVKVEDLPAHIPQAVLAIEDRRFYSHFGLDVIGVARAMVTNVSKGRLAQGGSTITQQLAKNLFLSRDRTFKRKIQEAILAIWLEQELTKDEILSAYLNIVFMGSGAFGIEAAAKTYFDKDAKDLDLYEAAMMAGLLKAPSRFSPRSNPDLAAQRARVVLSAMVDAGFITEQERAQQTLAAQARRSKPNSEASRNNSRYFSDWISSGLDDFIGTPQENITVRTTLDSDLQKRAETIMADSISKNQDRDVTQGALVLMDYSGAVLAMVGGVDYSQSQFNRATQAMRPAGSAFKPFVYLTALEQGRRMDDLIDDAKLETGQYRPSNFDDQYYGEIPMYFALAQSLNTISVRLMRDVGAGAVIDTARRLGIEAPLDHNLSLALGSSGIPLLELTSAYGSLANGGIAFYPHAIEAIETSTNTPLYLRSDLIPTTRVVEENAAYQIREMMSYVVKYGTGRAASFDNNLFIAGKTGTSQDYRDAWFIGYTDHFIAGVWVGNDDNSSMSRLTGGGLPARIWRDMMAAAHQPRYKNRYRNLYDMTFDQNALVLQHNNADVQAVFVNDDLRDEDTYYANDNNSAQGRSWRVENNQLPQRGNELTRNQEPKNEEKTSGFRSFQSVLSRMAGE